MKKKSLERSFEEDYNEVAMQGNVHLLGFQVIKNHDDFCDSFVSDDLTSILLFAEELILLDEEASSEMQGWTVFLTALWNVYKASEAYYDELERTVVDQNGAIPPVFVNKKSRDSYGTFVRS